MLRSAALASELVPITRLIRVPAGPVLPARNRGSARWPARARRRRRAGCGRPGRGRRHALIQDADRGDDPDAQRERQQQHDETAAGAAQVARAEPDGQRPVAAVDQSAATLARGAAGSIKRPRSIVSRRRHRAASAGSWVISSSVIDRAAQAAKIRSTTAWPVSASRLPVGSSASSRRWPVRRAPAPGPPAAARRRTAGPDSG